MQFVSNKLPHSQNNKFNITNKIFFSDEIFKSDFNKKPNIEDPFPDFLLNYLENKSSFSFEKENVLFRELEFAYIHNYIKDLSAKIINLIQNYHHDIEEISKYEQKLEDLLSKIHKFFKISYNLEVFSEHALLFCDELLQVLLYTDNWNLINKILLSMHIGPDWGKKKHFDKLKKEAKYIVLYIDQYIFFNNKEDVNPYYELFRFSPDFIDLKNEIEKNLYSALKINFYKEIKDANTFYFDLKLKDGAHQKFELSSFNLIYSIEKPSYCILKQILDDNNHSDLREKDFKEYVKLLFSIKQIKSNENPHKNFNLLSCVNILTMLRQSSSGITFGYDNSDESTPKHLNNNICSFLYFPSYLIQDRNLLKQVLISLGCSNIYSMKKDFKNKEIALKLFSKKICEAANNILSQYHNDYEIISLVFHNLVFDCLDLLNNENEKDAIKDTFYPFLESFFKTHFVNQENFAADPINCLCNIDLQSIWKLFLKNMKKYCIETDNQKIFMESFTKTINFLIETVINLDPPKKLFEKYHKFHIFESLYEPIRENFLESSYAEATTIAEKFKGFFSHFLSKIKNTQQPDVINFYRNFLDYFSKFFSDKLKVSEDERERECFIEIIEELFLRREMLCDLNLINLYKDWLNLYFENYSLSDLEKNVKAYHRFANFFKIAIIIIINFRNKTSPLLFSETDFITKYKSLCVEEMIRYLEDYYEKVYKEEIIDLTNTLVKLAKDENKENIYEIYLTFIMFRSRKLQKGLLELMSSWKSINCEVKFNQIVALDKFTAEMLSYPLLLPIRESQQLSFYNYPDKIKNNGENDPEIFIGDYFFEKIAENFENFENSFKRLAKISKEKNIFLFSFFSNKRKLNYGEFKKEENMVYVKDFLANSIKKIIEEKEILNDLITLGKMKYYLGIAKNTVMNENNNIAKFIYVFEKFLPFIHEITHLFPHEYLKSQIFQLELVNNNQLYKPSEYCLEKIDRNIFYSRINCTYYKSLKILTKGFKLMNRTIGILKQIYNFSKDQLNSSQEDQKNKIKNLFKEFLEKALEDLDLSFNESNKEEKNIFLIKFIFISEFVKKYLEGLHEAFPELSNKFLLKLSKVQQKIFILLENEKELLKTKLIVGEIDQDKFKSLNFYNMAYVYTKNESSYHYKIVNSLKNKKFYEQSQEQFSECLMIFEQIFKSCYNIDDFLEFNQFHYEFGSFSFNLELENNEGDKCVKDRVSKTMDSIFKITMQHFLKSIRLSFDLEYFFNFIQNVYKTQNKNSNELLERKAITLKVADYLELILNDLSKENKFNLKEECEIIKEITTEFSVNPYHTNFEVFFPLEDLALEKKNFLLLAFTIVLSNLMAFNNENYSTESFKVLFPSNFEFFYKFCGVLLENFKIIEKMPEGQIKIYSFNQIYKFLSRILYPFFDDNYLPNLIENKPDLSLKALHILKIFLYIIISPNSEGNSDSSIITKLLKTILSFFKEIKDYSDNSKQILNELISMIFDLQHQRIPYNDNYYGTQNNHIFIIMFSRIISLLDGFENDSLTKFSIELKIKRLFYNQKECKQTNEIACEDFYSAKNVEFDFAYYQHLYYEIFNSLCELSEDKSLFKLREGIDLDKIQMVEEKYTISQKIREIIDFLIRNIVSSVGLIINHYTKSDNEVSNNFEYLPAINHGICVQVLKFLLKMYPPLIICFLESKIDFELIENDYKPLNYLYSLLKEKSQNNRIQMKDFLFTTCHFNNSTSYQLFSVLFDNDYYYKYYEIDNKKVLVSSSILSKYGILNDCCDRIQNLLQGKKVFTDFESFLLFQHLQRLVYNLFKKTKISCDSNHLSRLYESLNIKLFNLCISILKGFNDERYVNFLKINSTFYYLFKKINNRLIKTNILKIKGAYVKDDMNFYKHYIHDNLGSILSNLDLKTKNEEALIIKKDINLELINEYHQIQENIKSTNFIDPPANYITNKKQIKFNIYSLFDNLRDEMQEVPFTLDYDWIKDIMKNENIFKKQNNLIVNFSNYYRFYSNVIFSYYYLIDLDEIEKIYSSNCNEIKIDSFRNLIETLQNEAKDEQELEQEKDKEQEQQEKEKEENKDNEEQNKENQEEKIAEPKIEEEIKESNQESENKEKESSNEVFDFVSKGFPIDSLTLYGIDPIYFGGLDEITKEELLKEEKKKYDEKIASENQNKSTNSYDFEANGFPIDALTLYSIDKEYFDNVPEDMKKEVLEQGRTDYQKKEEEKKKEEEEKQSNETFKKKLRVLCIRENIALFKLAANKINNFKDKEFISEEEWNNLCKNINELDENVKGEIFRSFPYELIKDLPKDLKDSAKRYRKAGIDFYRKRKEPKEDDCSVSSSLLSIDEQLIENGDNDNSFEKVEIDSEIKNEDALYEELIKNHKLELIDQNIPEIEDDTIFALINNMSFADNSDHINALKRLIKSFCLSPINAYKILDSLIFVLTFYDEYEKALNESNNEKIKSANFTKKLIKNSLTFSGSILTIDSLEIRKLIFEIIAFLIEKKLILKILLNGYTFGCTDLIFENSHYKVCKDIQDMRSLLSERKIVAKKETILEKLMYSSKECCSDVPSFFRNLFEILEFKEEANQTFLYPKTLCNIPKIKIMNEVANIMSCNLLSDIFENIEKKFSSDPDSFLEYIIKTFENDIKKKFDNDFSTKKNKLIKLKKDESLENNISSIKDQDKRSKLKSMVLEQCCFNYYELKDLRKYFRSILVKLKTCLKKNAKALGNKLIDQKLSEENPALFKQTHKKEFNRIMNESLQKFNDKIHESEIILKFFREYFDFMLVIYNIVGSDFSWDDYDLRETYTRNRSIFKLFIDIYSFVNPLKKYLVEEIIKQEEDIPLRSSIPQLSKLKTSAPQEEKKEKKFKSEKIGKIFGAFARKADIDMSLKNTFSFAYGSFSFCVDMLAQYSFGNRGKISKSYYYYIKKAPNEQSVSTNLKFYYLAYEAKESASKKCEFNGSLSIVLNRDCIWQSTLKYFASNPPSLITNSSISISFENEAGIDAGGLTREWLSLLVKEVFNPDYGLFKASENKISFQPNPLSHIVPDHLMHFRMFGRLIGKAIIQKWNIEVFFVKSFLKHILQKTLYIDDLQDVDAELYNSMKWVLENPVEDMGFVFSYEMKEFDKLKTVELIENGNQIDVTEENKKEFVKAIAYAKMAKEIQPQTEALIQGISEIIPIEALSIINEKDLGVRLAGSQKIDVDEMEKFCVFYSYGPNDNIVKWLFEILREFDEELKSKFIFYILGCFRVPIGGFKAFPMKISSMYDTKSLPQAHTCFGQIDLPNYETKQILRDKLVMAMTEGGGSGFFIG